LPARELIRAIAEAASDDQVKPLAVYVHIPFCSSKCHFCDWVVDVPVHRLRSDVAQRQDYLTALGRQIRYYGPLLTSIGYRPTVMYWGGGTPVRLTPGEMRGIKAALDEAFDLSCLEQWSVESTPNDLSADKLEAMRGLGVSRVSIGVQSFNPFQLRRSGRAHTAGQGAAAVGLLRAAGFSNFNIDLISSFPGEDRASFAATLQRTLELDPPHISVYPYRATPKTVMAMQLERSELAAHDPAGMIGAYELAMAMLRDAGYYEYCHGYWVRRPEDEDKDGNYKYDLAGDKFGFGSGAESIIGHHLLWNENARYAEYLEDPCGFTFSRRFTLAEPDLLTAPVGGALMTREGVVYDRFARLTGLSFAAVRATPYMRRWLDVLAECGARYLETPASFRMEPGTIHRAYINHLAYTMSAGLDIPRA
jgi:oxygen-independent coproporphyrinogen-3 oxidase